MCGECLWKVGQDGQPVGQQLVPMVHEQHLQSLPVVLASIVHCELHYISAAELTEEAGIVALDGHVCTTQNLL